MPPAAASSRSFGTPALLPIPTCAAVRNHCRHPMSTLLYESVTASGRKPTVAPRPMTIAEIRQTVADYARAARNAMVAGFDGLEILAAYLYLIPQFLNRTTNRRTDEYGGSIENRAPHPVRSRRCGSRRGRSIASRRQDRPDA